MKKFLILSIFIMFSCIFAAPVMADDIDLPATGDLWDNWNTREEGREATPVTDEQFDKALEQVDKKVNKWRNWANKRKIPKGQEFSQSNETEIINNQHGDKDALPVVCIPVGLMAGEDIVPIGHYQIKGEKINGQPVLQLYQAHNVMAQFPAVETSDDFGENAILFAKWVPQNDNQIKLIYGSLELNAYAIIEIAN